MQKLLVWPLTVMLSCWLLAPAGYACSSVFVNQDQTKRVGRTMDWKTGVGRVCVNERGLTKQAQYLQDKSSPAVWTSAYGSVSFNLQIQFNLAAKILMWLSGMVNPSSPSCGLNEKGLWGGSLWLHTPPAVKYPAADARKSLNDWQWLEYCLDNFASVQELVAHAGDLRISGFKEAGFEVDIHWFFADASGDSVIIEFPDGQMRLHRRPEPAVMTNSFFEHSREFAQAYQGFGGQTPVPLGTGETTSENRFLFAAQLLQEKLAAKQTSPADIFEIMQSATQTNVRHASTSQAVTQWTTVYDLPSRELSWTSRNLPKVRTLKLSEIDFNPTDKKRSLDIQADLAGDLTAYFK